VGLGPSEAISCSCYLGLTPILPTSGSGGGTSRAQPFSSVLGAAMDDTGRWMYFVGAAGRLPHLKPLLLSVSCSIHDMAHPAGWLPQASAWQDHACSPAMCHACPAETFPVLAPVCLQVGHLRQQYPNITTIHLHLPSTLPAAAASDGIRLLYNFSCLHSLRLG
jgi:hypothetical protein